jgi:DNA polymerase (family 10)
MEAFLATDSRKETLWQGESKSSIVLNTGLQVDLRVVPRESFGAAMQYFTGSKAHNVKLRERAVARKLKVNEYGVFQEGEEQPLAGQTEESVYEALGLVWIPPELREGFNEIDLAEQDNLPPLLEEKHIRGALHNHTTDSDGRLNLEELVEEAKARGYQYLAVTDHSSTLSVARGLDSARLRKQIEQIRAFNQKHPDFPVLAGSEVDIRTDGTLDFSDDDLAQLDFVIAAIHSQFNLSQADMTKRICSALANPYVDLLAHPTGRLVARREGFAVDMEALYQTAAETGTALEINAQDMRLDLRDQHIREAKAYGIVFSINTDTHADSDFDHLAFGVGTARRARLQKEDVINTWTLKQLQTWQKKRKG